MTVRPITRAVNLLLLLVMAASLLAGCTLEASAANKAYRREVHSRVARMIDEELSTVLPYVEDELPSDFRSVGTISGDAVVSRMLSEDKGEEYIDFSYALMTHRDVEGVLKAAEELVPEEEMVKLREDIEAEEARAMAFYEEASRDLTSAQQKAFYSDIKKLVVKASVLLTAAVVYAFIPNTVVWGKVSAACAAAVAAGFVASGILTVFEYHRYDTDQPALDEWIESVYKDSYAAWGLAASVIATGTAAKRSPVVTALIVAVFAAYNVLKDVRPLLKKYNFSI